MNPLTLVKRTQKITSTEAALGISDEASWHAKYKDSAYVFVGGLSYDLTEGDLLAVFSQYASLFPFHSLQRSPDISNYLQSGDLKVWCFVHKC